MRMDGRRARGNRSREAVLKAGVVLATVSGLAGFSLSELSTASGVSKANIAVLFGPKRDLQVAILERARQVLYERLFAPVAASPNGLQRLRTLGDVWLDYLSDPELTGGCFFAAASFELDTQPGRLKGLVSDDINRWVASIAEMIEFAQKKGEISKKVVADDDAFALFAIGVTANTMIQLGPPELHAGRARRAWRKHLDRITRVSDS